MNGNDLKVWLINNNMRQKTLAHTLGLSLKTLSTYANGKPPKWLKFALVGVISEKNKGSK